MDGTAITGDGQQSTKDLQRNDATGFGDGRSFARSREDGQRKYPVKIDRGTAEDNTTEDDRTYGHETIQTLTAHYSLSGDTTVVGDLFGHYYDYYYYNDKNNVIIVISIGGRRH